METPESVRQWADATFGPAEIATQVDRAQEELRELIHAVYSDYSDEQIAMEAADVVICLYRVIAALSPTAIEDKMRINRARTWNVTKEGVAQHV